MNKKERKILQEAMDRFNESFAREYQNRSDALISSQFVDGNQWNPDDRARRESMNRPVLTINKLRKYVLQIVGELQQNRPELMVSPKRGGASTVGAQIRNDIIRSIEDMSNANVAYDTGVQQALEGGYGFWRIVTEYEKDSFDQNILIKRVPNRFSVVMDQYSQLPTYEDGRYAFVIETVPRSKFEYDYPSVSANISSMEHPYGMYEWFTKDSVTIAEYFWKEPYKEEIWKLESGVVLTHEQIKELEETGTIDDLESPVIEKRQQTKYRIRWIKMTYNNILEGPLDFPGDYIPIVPVLGYEFNDQGMRRFRGIAYDALDAARMYNYWKVAIVEILSSAPKTTRLVTPEQIDGHQQQWNNINEIPQPYVLYNAIPGQPPIVKEEPMGIPVGAASEAQSAAQDIQDTIGLFAASMGQPSNERTGRAIRLRQERGDNTVYTFINNYQNALLYTGRILLSMIPEVYNSQRILNILSKDGEFQELRLNYPSIDLRNAEQVIENDLTEGEYDMIPTIGPNYATKRKEVVASMMDFLQFFPSAGPMLAPRIAKLMDWEGAQRIGEELQQMLQQQAEMASQKSAQPKNTSASAVQNAMGTQSNF
jgi:hypothetical protein